MMALKSRWKVLEMDSGGGLHDNGNALKLPNQIFKNGSNGTFYVYVCLPIHPNKKAG